ncbi:MAG: IscS subfamily cysteine desulfurase [Gammaproteobacteria bacterium]|nr:IscS subfamily cysteine desulfurase [Gammaproteobacteria bacterium]
MTKSESPIFLDYAAGTPTDPRVAEKMFACLTPDGLFANPASSSHVLGRRAKGAVENARGQVADLVGASRQEIIWTSGATESDNLAITGSARFRRDQGDHIITSIIEHKAVLDTCKQLAKEGFEVTYLRPTAAGMIEPQQVAEAMRDDTILVSLMHVNNELGTITDIATIGDLCRERAVLFHVDAAQSVGKIPINLAELNVDMMSFTAHKIYGPKGIGALYVCHNPRVQLEPIIHGGGHELGLRAGTLATHQIVGMGEAYALAGAELESDHQRLLALREKLWCGLSALDGVWLNGDPRQRVAGILNVSFEGVEGESLLLALHKLAVSSGSACISASTEASYVLRALGRDDQLGQASVRFSVGRFTTEADIDIAIAETTRQVARMRALVPKTESADGS